MRTVFAALGGLALLWGGYLAVELLIGSSRDGIQVVAFVVGGPLVHDALIAPLVGLVGLLIARRVPERWRGPVGVGAAATGTLGLLAVPFLWRPYGVPTNPGLHDRDYAAGLAIAIAVVWTLVSVFCAVRSRRG